MAGSDRVQAVEQGLEILERVAAAPEGLSLAALAEAMGLKPTTIHNLARTLVATGYLAKRTRPTRYTLGPAVGRLARLSQHRFLDQALVEAVRALADAFADATVTSSQAIGTEVVAVLRISPERPGVLEQPAHQVMSPYHSASALVFQAFWPGETREAYRRRYPFEEYGRGRWGSLSDLEAFLDQVRGAGAVVLEPNGESRLLRVAAPVYSPRQELVACFGVSMPGDAVERPATGALAERVLAESRAIRDSSEPDLILTGDESC